MSTTRRKHRRYHRITEDGQPSLETGGDKARAQRRKNALARKEMFPDGLLAALNARHIDGDPNELLRVLNGWDVEAADTRPGFRYLPWDVPAAVRDADAELITKLAELVTFYPGDPRSPEPLHLIPLHVAVLVLRQVAEGNSAVYASAIRALDHTANTLAKDHGKPTTILERVGAAQNCVAAITLLLSYDRLPRAVRRWLGRCQNLRCPRGRPFLVGLEAKPTACAKGTGCRTRVAERKRRTV